jgi:protein-disulfide isomerase
VRPGRAFIVPLFLLAGAVAPAAGQVDLTVDPAMTRGPAHAPVTIVAFSDFECPYCKRVLRALDQVLQEYDGRVRLIAKDLPLTSHPQARQAAEAARCAGAEGRYWPYHDRLFAEQPRFGRDRLVGYAVDLGLDREAFARCLGERRFARRVEDDLAQARALGIVSTPTFLINGRVLVGARPADDFRAVIEEVLRRGAAREGRR